MAIIDHWQKFEYDQSNSDKNNLTNCVCISWSVYHQTMCSMVLWFQHHHLCCVHSILSPNGAEYMLLHRKGSSVEDTGDNRHNLPYHSKCKNGKQNSFSFPTLHIINIITPPPNQPHSSSSIILIDLVQCECVDRWLWMCRKVCRLMVYKGGCKTFNKSAATCPLPCATIDPDELNTRQKSSENSSMTR